MPVFDAGQMFSVSSLCSLEVQYCGCTVRNANSPLVTALSCLQALRKFESQLKINFHKQVFFKLD